MNDTKKTRRGACVRPSVAPIGGGIVCMRPDGMKPTEKEIAAGRRIYADVSLRILAEKKAMLDLLGMFDRNMTAATAASRESVESLAYLAHELNKRHKVIMREAFALLVGTFGDKVKGVA